MKQLEIRIVRIQLRAEDERGASGETMTWNALPDQSKGEIVRHLAEVLRAHLERRAVDEASDE